MIYKQFHIHRFRGISDVSVSLIKGDLVLLLGLNESGKTTILKAIEAFDYLNDPEKPHADDLFSSVRNKSDMYTNESALVSADIRLDTNLKIEDFSDVLRKFSSPATKQDKASLLEAFLREANTAGTLKLSRVFPFRKGNPLKPYYQFESGHPLTKEKMFASEIGMRIVEMCPFIIYFEDFTDRIPDQIFINSRHYGYNPDWYDIVDGLFYHTDDKFSIEAFKKLFSRTSPRPDDAKTVMKRVNKTLDKVFTKKWEKLSGVKDIEDTELIAHFTRNNKHFEIKITDTDGTTYSVDERSKGALWYLSFLMKTEFRRKKMRKDSGKPIFLIDEPASNLHSTAQQNMIEDFQQLVEDTSVIYTTHSQYLISLENIKNTYIIRRHKGTVSATSWADFLREEIPQVSHYQPLANLLELVPNNLDVPWPKAVITEGPSDMHILDLMYQVLNIKPAEFVIYPGTSAFNLATLISLNIGWGSDFRVLLDSDSAGIEAQRKYIDSFELDDNIVITLPKKNSKIESYFSVKEKEALYKLAFGKAKDKKVSKNEFNKAITILSGNKDSIVPIKSILSKTTLGQFRTLFSRIGF